MADRIGVINKGELILVEEKAELMRKLGSKQLTLQLQQPLQRIPAALARYHLELARRRQRAHLHLRQRGEPERHRGAARRPGRAGIRFKDLQTTQSSLEDIFVSLREGRRNERPRDPRDLQVRDGAHRPHADAEHHLAGDLDRALLRRVRRGDRRRASSRSRASATAPSSCRG